MDIAAVWSFIAGLLPVGVAQVVGYVLMGLGTLVVLAYAYVKVTPSQDDDAWFAKLEAMPVLGDLLKFLMKFSPVSRKE